MKLVSFFGRQYRSGGTVLQRHRHRHGYLVLVLSGGYEEAGDRGRFHVQPGSVVLHGAFEAHLDRYASTGAEVLNIALPNHVEAPGPVMQVGDPDRAARMAERDLQQALEFVFSTMRPLCLCASDWPDELAAALLRDPHLRLQEWARAYQLADATVSRGFQKVFGITPSAYRAQLRGTMAWKQAVKTSRSLADVALDLGFSDQAHMTRTIRALTGRPPGAWRADQIDSRHREIGAAL